MVSAISPVFETIFSFLGPTQVATDSDGRSVQVLSDGSESGNAPRVGIHTASDFMEEFKKTCARAAKFFSHVYADIRLFIRSCSKVPSLSREGALTATRNEIERFRDRCRLPAREHVDTAQEFRNLSSVTRELFYRIDEDFLIKYRRESSPEARNEMKNEITRECDRILQYQRVVYFFSLLFQSTRGGPATERGWVPSSSPSRAPGVTVNGVRIDIPGTVAFTQNAISADVQRKAAEIEVLIRKFDVLPNPPKSPESYLCPILCDFMKIPVFDASHPSVQASLATPPDAGNLNNSLEAHRTVRHTIESSALLSLTTPGKCPSCRHPRDGGMRREYMRINTQLQDEILQFLRNATANP